MMERLTLFSDLGPSDPRTLLLLSVISSHHMERRLFPRTPSPPLEVYVSEFEDDFLAASAEYYARKSAAWLEAHSTPEYLVEAERALHAEQLRVRECLHGSTEPKLLEVVTVTSHESRTERNGTAGGGVGGWGCVRRACVGRAVVPSSTIMAEPKLLVEGTV